MDHDLIAAGHPRLSFEFHAYFESLPAHWERDNDAATQGASFHAQSWLAGQRQHSTQLCELHDYFEARLGGTLDEEFSLFDCAACHHPLTAGRASDGMLRAPRWPRGDLQDTSKSPIVFVQDLLSQSAQSDAGFDDAVGAYLAARALTADLKSDSKADDLRAALVELGRFLGRECFGAIGGRLPSPYDAPQRFDRAALAQRIQAVSAALDQLKQP